MKRLAAIGIMISVVLGLPPAARGVELPTFTDVPAGSWFEQGVLTCAQNGIMVGRGENTFAPEATLTDAECLMLAYRLYDQANGGDGSLLKMPEDYGYIRIVSEDGSVVREGYAGDGSLWAVPNIHYSSEGYRLCLVGYSADEESKAGTATLTFDGKEYRGTLQRMFRGSGRYEQDRFFGFEPEDSALNRMMVDACYDTAPPTLWWADLLYTIDQKGWRETFGSYCLLFGNEESRGSFADLLGTVTNLPKRFDVPSIPDLGERGETGSYSDHIYGLYEAGILGGVDPYGTFDVEKTLTRAEAATMVTRILDESRRLTDPPQPMPENGTGYTLTYLMDGVFADGQKWDTYPYCAVGEYTEENLFFAMPVGLLTLEGEYTPWIEELDGDYTSWIDELEKKIKMPDGWQNWGGLQIAEESPSLGLQPYYLWPTGSPASEKFDWCGKIGPDGRGFVQRDGKLYRIEFTQPEQ